MHAIVTCQMHTNMAEVLRRQGDLAAALERARRGLAIKERWLRPDHADVHTRSS